ncbi:MAG: homoaconitase [FCB group bacterium]|nr:homoaconitase [FCB group bacterium]
MKHQNLIEKITQRYTVGLPPGRMVHSGDFVSLQPAHILTHDNTGAVMKKFRAIGAKKMADPRQPMFALDHNVQDRSRENLKKYEGIESFARDMGVDFYPAGQGIGHQIMIEEGYAFPGTLAVASDSHANMYGGIGCLGTPVVRTDAAAVWATGRTWWQIPLVTRVHLTGTLSPGVTGKDVIITLAGQFNHDEVLNHALEFTGEGVATLSIEERLTIANMTTEWGALTGVFPVDETTLEWLENRIIRLGDDHPRINRETIANLKAALPVPDEDALYFQEISLDLSTVTPSVSGPHNLKTMTPVSAFESKHITIQKAYLVSCVNSRVSDLAAAAEVVRGKQVAPGVEFYIAAASKEVQEISEQRGDWQTLIAAGARPLPPGCGPCIGLGTGLLQDGEVGISATNRNFKGRMGSPQAEAYLASPAVVAASALAGRITGPEPVSGTQLIADIQRFEQSSSSAQESTLLPGFPEIVAGEIVFCPADNLNTDGIFPGKYTYLDDFTLEQQAQVVMENYDPEFGQVVKRGDILASGYNFGTGSSREQAATALKARGFQLVLAGSFSQTYKRNALNNGFLVLEVPQLIDELLTRFGRSALTVRTGIQAELNFRTATLTVKNQTYPLPVLGPAAQELIIEGGLENWVKRRLTTES